MSLPDLIYCHPSHTVYPLWMKFIHENRERFNKVIVVFTNMNAEWNYKNYIMDQMKSDRVNFFDNDVVSGEQDWRNVGVNKALSYSDSEWVWFSEQDFEVVNDIFWSTVETCSTLFAVFGLFQEKRLHPCCTFIKRSLLETTKKNFGVLPNKLDHFGLLQQELEERDVNIGPINIHTCSHMNGLSQNMWLLQNGEEPNFRPEDFKDYCRKCLELDIHPDFRKLFSEYIK